MNKIYKSEKKISIRKDTVRKLSLVQLTGVAGGSDGGFSYSCTTCGRSGHGLGC